MVTIIATIKPAHLNDIRAGRKKYEMRKTTPAAGVPFRVLCCESGSGGKIKAEFICDKVYHYSNIHSGALFVRESCVTMRQAEEYAAGKKISFWHVSEMKDYCSTRGCRVRNISEFGMRRPPQSWCYVEEE